MTDNKMSWQSVMPENEKLYWKDGSSNIVPFLKSLIKYARLHFVEEIVQVLVNLAIPVEWTSRYEPPLIPPMGDFEIARELKKEEDHNKKFDYWNNNKGRLTTYLTLCQSESSTLRLEKYHESKVEELIKNGDVIELLKLIKSSHTFIGATSGFDDADAMDIEWGKFQPDEGDDLDSYTNKYQKLIKRCQEVGLKIKKKKKMYRYLKGLRQYQRSNAVVAEVVNYIADVDTSNFPTNFAEIVDKLQGLEQAENAVEKKKTNSNRFAVHAFLKVQQDEVDKNKNKSNKDKDMTFPSGATGIKHSDGSFQVHTTVGLSKKFKKGSEEYNGLFKPTHVGNNKRKFERTQNSHMEAYVKKHLSKLGKLSSDEYKRKKSELYKSTLCDKCKKPGHLKGDCKAQVGAEQTQTRSVNTTSFVDEPEISVASKRNTSGFFSVYSTFSKPMSEEEMYRDQLIKEKNMEYLNGDDHANIHVFMNKRLLTNIRKVVPIKVKGFGGFYKHLDTVGDHPLLGEVFLDEDNDFNIVSITALRTEHGYFRQFSEDNLKQYLSNDEIRSVFTFELDPADGFYKISIKEFNKELMRIYPNMCMSIS